MDTVASPHSMGPSEVLQVLQGPGTTMLYISVGTAIWFCSCGDKAFWQGVGSGIWDELKGLWDGAMSGLKAAKWAPAMMARPGSGLAMEMAISVEIHRVIASLYAMARNGEFLEIIKTLAPEVGVLLTHPMGSPDWCKALGSLFGSGTFELLTLLLAPELTPAKLAALAGKLGPRIGKAADDVAELIRKAHKLMEPQCFVAGTLVATAVGLVPIETIQAGDLVWARDEVTGEVRLCEVAETYRRESAPIVEVIAGGEFIATTPEHPFWVQDHGWKAAGDLHVGDSLVTIFGESVVVQDIRRRPVPEPVYNLRISGLHTYFVGRGGVWVHNTCAGRVGDLSIPSSVDDFLSRKIESLPDSERVFVIGENQRGRVNPAARSIDAMTATDFWPDEMKFDLPLSAIDEARSIQFNRYLIERLHSEGFQFLDIGPKGAIPTSLWYNAELETLERLGGHAWPWPGSGF